MTFLIREIYIKGKTPWISFWILIITFSFTFKQVILTSICTSCVVPPSACNFYQVIYRSYSYCRSCRTLSCINYYKFPTDITTNFDVEALDMSERNYLEIIGEGQLQKTNLPKLKVLAIRRCSIYEIRLGTFVGMDSLIELDLSQNFINNLNPKVFLGLNKLKLLNLSGNPIREFQPESVFPVLPLIVLDLSNCEVRSVESELFQNLKTLHNIQLDHNNLTSLDWRFLVNMKSLHILTLEGNPWHCDCHIKFLMNALMAKKLTASLHLATCATTEPDLPLPEQTSLFWVYNNSIIMTCKPKVEKFTYMSYETFQGGFNFDAQDKFGIRRISEKAKVNDEIHFECVFSGYPPPRPTFSKLSRQRIIINQGLNCPAPANQTDPIFDINRFSYREILTISSVSEEDQGQYECFVNNSAGSDSRLVDFYLIGERGASKESHGIGESNKMTDISIESLVMENEWIVGGILAFVLGVAGIALLFLCFRKKKSSYDKKMPVPKINVKRDNPKVTKPLTDDIRPDTKQQEYKPLLSNTLQIPKNPITPPPVDSSLKRTGRGTIIIGTDTCEVASIVSVLISAEPKDILREKLTEIGTWLGVNYIVIKNINRRLILDTLDLCGAITEVINAWVVTKGTEDAKLRTLLEVFEKLELIAFKQLLEKEFGIVAKSTALRLCPSFSSSPDTKKADLSACQNYREENVKFYKDNVCNLSSNSQTLVEIVHETRPTKHETIQNEMKAEQPSLPASTITITDANELSYETCKKYSLEVLQKKDPENLPEDVNPAQKEMHLNKEDFQSVFGMSYEAFCNLLEWKRKEMKISVGLF